MKDPQRFSEIARRAYVGGAPVGDSLTEDVRYLVSVIDSLRQYEPCDECPEDCAKCASGNPWLYCGDCQFYAASDG
jgi:hypothetical protein